MKMVSAALLAMVALATACGTANQGGSEVKTVVNNPTYQGTPIILHLGQSVDRNVADEICKDQGFSSCIGGIILEPSERIGRFAVYGDNWPNGVTKKVLNNVQGNVVQKINCEL